MKIIKNLTITAFFAFSLLQGFVFSAENQFVAGKDYDIISNKQSEEPMIEEFFNYACGACFSTEQFVTNLKKKHPKLKVQPVPVELRDSWKIYAEAYYIGEKLGVLDKSHGKLFEFIHIQKKRLNNKSDMKAFFLELGVTAKDYDGIANSYWLNTQLRKAKQRAIKSQVISTPVFLVNKKYKINSKAIGSYESIEKAIIELSGLYHNENKTKTIITQ